MTWGRCFKNERVKTSMFFVLCGPSGVGKSTLIRKVLEEKPGEVTHPVTYTTRALRPGEVQGRDIRSIPRCDWTPRLTGKEYLASTVYQGELYGTLKEDILNPLLEGMRAIVAFDENGVDCVRESDIPAVYVYLIPNKIEQLETWLLKRWPDGGPEFERRLLLAQQETQQFEDDPAFRAKFDYWIVSDDMDQMTHDMLEIMGFTRD